jgi:hypothetical protein
MLAALNSADYLRVRRQTPSGALEQALHKAGPAHYGLILALLSACLNHPDDDLSNSLLSQAITAMDSMDLFNAQLVGRGCCLIYPRRVRDGPDESEGKPVELLRVALPLLDHLDPQVQIDRRPDTASLRVRERAAGSSWA